MAKPPEKKSCPPDSTAANCPANCPIADDRRQPCPCHPPAPVIITRHPAALPPIAPPSSGLFYSRNQPASRRPNRHPDAAQPASRRRPTGIPTPPNHHPGAAQPSSRRPCRHSGASRNLAALPDSRFRRSDRPPKPNHLNRNAAAPPRSSFRGSRPPLTTPAAVPGSFRCPSAAAVRPPAAPDPRRHPAAPRAPPPRSGLQKSCPPPACAAQKSAA